MKYAEHSLKSVKNTQVLKIFWKNCQNQLIRDRNESKVCLIYKIKRKITLQLK